jgi:hypothetical protein
MRSKLIAVLVVLLWIEVGFASDRCDSLVAPIKKVSQYYLGYEFPWWYNVGVAKKETNCRWVSSLDGYGSVGYFQLTPKFLDRLLRPLFPDYDKSYSSQHFEAFAYYVGMLLKSSPVRKLWVVYQRYNGGDWVLRECQRVGCWVWEECYRECRRGSVCVWRTVDGCKQWRSACEINYEYSLRVWQYGRRWKEGEDRVEYW